MNSSPSQSSVILQILTTLRGRWVSMPTLARVSGAYAVHSRIAELNERGHRISNRIEHGKRGKKRSWYRLEVA